ncbi:cilia- and flagella-associated protein 251-like isoform X3 [Entelurus aequoreus]|uniref:cilia- and flagella-associated protein 251-like isoform X3 n=1 Tax=Entelurus aequoreus TaxID=161455 RepID=UPI002B1E3C88|nr:cilia- and flagella-associated protein 251-like isoform X3 [Entelurus aequoreus]XP_061882228.1 cilia- and flagella-associated protein 251-like isoform X3 [Entelurus aequoreus]XP_061882229.1 cilia- and flagella-associated protein 251-like isoform X3 [Entelurus aequoreus]XP_061882230.1 cilia- and flagella-associated protein 251-like isoform X3 [Entelurus aequoreus]XP_061882231.1 cilia- and flagella-associated protein 251-like isoform X3 [Entelurus aequoreus]
MCERTIAEYEEELCPTKEEKERQHQVGLHTTDIHQLIGHQEECLPHLQGDTFTLEDPQPSHFKGDKEDPHMKEEEEGECVVGQEEDDVSKFPLTVVSVKTEEHEDKARESSQLHHSPNVQQPLHIKEEDDDPQPTYIKEEEEDPQPPHMKEEEEEPHMKEEEEGGCVVGQEEDDVSKFPLTVVSVKTEEHEDKAPESSQLHHSPSPPDVWCPIWRSTGALPCDVGRGSI